MSDISNRILDILLSKNISYGELSELTGIPKSALQRYATGQTEKIPIDRLELIAKAIGTTSAYLMGWEQSPSGKQSERPQITDEDIQFALFGGRDEITERMYDEVKKFAAYIKQREGYDK